MYLFYLESAIFINKGVFEHSTMALTETICEYQTQLFVDCSKSSSNIR